MIKLVPGIKVTIPMSVMYGGSRMVFVKKIRVIRSTIVN